MLAEKRAEKRNMMNTKMLLNVTLALLVGGFLLLAGLGLTTSQSDQRQHEQQHPLSDSNHVYIPSLGFGTWNLDRSNASEAVSLAIQTGYRHIDCAAAYGNQKEVGVGIADGIQKASINRYDLWVTSKLWNDRHQPDQVEQGLDETIADLGLIYVDLYLMHWPVESTAHGNKISYIDTWHAMGEISRHKARNIGISNFSPAQLRHLLASSSVKPAVHQFELHPYLQQTSWVKFHHEHDIDVTAYSPLGGTNPTYGKPNPDNGDPVALLSNPTLVEIASKRGCTPAQVALKWGIARDTSVIPKSARPEHIKEDYGAIGCKLLREDHDQITKLGEEIVKRYNNPSHEWRVTLLEGLDDT